jgi:eukaryotic-like serine/threonine-protein kinase
VVGTPHYLSPEAIRAPDEVDARSDLYSLGCVAYYLVTERTVFEGKSILEVAGHHLSSRPIPPTRWVGRSTPESLSALILSCLEKDPDFRPRSARDLQVTLDSLRGVEDWTEEDARAWWSTRGTTVTALARGMRRRNGAGEDPRAAPDGRSYIRCQKDRAGGHPPGEEEPLTLTMGR